MHYLILSAVGLIGAILLASVLAWRVGLWSAEAGRRLGVESQVDDRSSHARPTSRLGGLALAAGFFIPSAALTAMLFYMPRQAEGWGANLPSLAWLALGAVAFFLVGLADDLWDLPPTLKLAGQIAAAAPTLLAGLGAVHFPLRPPPGMAPEYFNAIIIPVWVVFFVNAFNFMDGMDGFAASFAKQVAVWLSAILLFQAGLHAEFGFLRIEFLLLPILAAACSGFLKVNAPPARVFMGDAGSHLLGYLLAIQAPLAAQNRFLALPQAYTSRTAAPGGAVIILLLPFIFDVVLTLIRRSWRGESLWKAHRSHLYQRLMIAGKSHAEVLKLNLNYFRLCGLLALTYTFVRDIPAARLSVWGVALLAMLHYWELTRRAEAKINQKESSVSSCNQPDASA